MAGALRHTGKLGCSISPAAHYLDPALEASTVFGQLGPGGGRVSLQDVVPCEMRRHTPQMASQQPRVATCRVPRCRWWPVVTCWSYGLAVL